MTKLVVTKEIESEIDLLYESHPDFADAVEVLLESLYEDLDLLERLHTPTTYPFHAPFFEVKIFIEASGKGYNIYSLKFKDLHGHSNIGYRIFLGFNAQRDIYYALALTHRSYAYDTNHPAYRDLCHRYEQYRIPKIT
ncbi:MAG: hypothetical protein JWP77_301 [Polaromonas sp.]|jgi:hypothetical protein|nr:hypothetical protein [Polaromonas sp.]